jgi:hypothetical protein
MRERRSSTALRIVGILVGITANVITNNAALSLVAEPVDARIRPMGPALMLFAGP